MVQQRGEEEGGAGQEHHLARDDDAHVPHGQSFPVGGAAERGADEEDVHRCEGVAELRRRRSDEDESRRRGGALVVGRARASHAPPRRPVRRRDRGAREAAEDGEHRRREAAAPQRARDAGAARTAGSRPSRRVLERRRRHRRSLVEVEALEVCPGDPPRRRRALAPHEPVKIAAPPQHAARLRRAGAARAIAQPLELDASLAQVGHPQRRLGRRLVGAAARERLVLARRAVDEEERRVLGGARREHEDAHAEERRDAVHVRRPRAAGDAVEGREQHDRPPRRRADGHHGEAEPPVLGRHRHEGGEQPPDDEAERRVHDRREQHQPQVPHDGEADDGGVVARLLDARRERLGEEHARQQHSRREHRQAVARLEREDVQSAERIPHRRN